MRVNAIGEHAQDAAADNKHNIVDDMYLLDADRIFEIPNETVLLQRWLIIKLSHYSFGLVGEQHHDRLLIPVSAYFNVNIANQLVRIRCRIVV